MFLEAEIRLPPLFFGGLVELHFFQLYDPNILSQVVEIHICLGVNEALFFEDVVLNYSIFSHVLLVYQQI